MPRKTPRLCARVYVTRRLSSVSNLERVPSKRGGGGGGEIGETLRGRIWFRKGGWNRFGKENCWKAHFSSAKLVPAYPVEGEMGRTVGRREH